MNAKTTGGRRPTERDLDVRVEELAQEILRLADSQAVFNVNVRRELHILTVYIIGLRQLLLDHGLVGAEELQALNEIAKLEADFEIPERKETPKC